MATTDILIQNIQVTGLESDIQSDKSFLWEVK